jgi:hypothetical protein
MTPGRSAPWRMGDSEGRTALMQFGIFDYIDDRGEPLREVMPALAGAS